MTGRSSSSGSRVGGVRSCGAPACRRPSAAPGKVRLQFPQAIPRDKARAAAGRARPTAMWWPGGTCVGSCLYNKVQEQCWPPHPALHRGPVERFIGALRASAGLASQLGFRLVIRRAAGGWCTAVTVMRGLRYSAVIHEEDGSGNSAGMLSARSGLRIIRRQGRQSARSAQLHGRGDSPLYSRPAVARIGPEPFPGSSKTKKSRENSTKSTLSI